MEIGSLLLNQRFAVPIVPYTEADLHEDLAQGVGNVLAGLGSDYRLEVVAENSAVLIRHKDANTGAGAGTGYSGALRCALGLTANGLVAGYNRQSDGAWVNSLVIDGTTGSATFNGTINAIDGNFSGTINAGAVIAGGALVNGTTLLTIKDGAAAGATAVQPAAIAGMLTASSSYILDGTISVTNAGDGIKTGTIAWDANGTVNAGSGVAITSKGIVGASNGVATFSINGTTGAAIFKGDVTGAYGTFAGGISSSGSIYVTGAYTGSLGIAGVYSKPASGSGVIGEGTGTRHGVIGYSAQGSGVYGYCGSAGAAGVYGEGYSTTGIALFAGGSGRIAVGGTSTQIYSASGLLRMRDNYSAGSDAFMLMIKTYGTGTGATATLGAKLGTNAAMAGWMTCTVAGATVYVPYWV